MHICWICIRTAELEPIYCKLVNLVNLKPVFQLQFYLLLSLYYLLFRDLPSCLFPVQCFQLFSLKWSIRCGGGGGAMGAQHPSPRSENGFQGWVLGPNGYWAPLPPHLQEGGKLSLPYTNSWVRPCFYLICSGIVKSFISFSFQVLGLNYLLQMGER